MVYVKVDWSEELPLKWNKHLQKALQSWWNTDAKEKCSIEKLRLLADDRTAEVEITPATGEILPLSVILKKVKE